MMPTQITWLVENRNAAAGPLAALSDEPVSRSERQRLHRLLNILKLTAENDGDSREAAAVASQLSSRDFAWLPAGPPRDVNHTINPDDAALAPSSQILLTVARALRQPRSHRLNFGLIYPLILLGLTGVVLVALSLVVVPQFRDMFDAFGLNLPLSTRLLFGLSQLLQHGGWLWVAAILTLVIAGWLLFRVGDRLANFRLSVGLRQRGGTAELLAMSRFCRRMAEAVAVDAPVTEAIRWAGSNCEHAHYERATSRLADEAQRGGLSPALIPNAKLFPANLLHALAAGEDSTQKINIPLLLTLAEIYEERAAGRGESGVTFVGIFAVFAVLCSVGFAAASLFMPLVQLITGLA